MFCKKKPDTLRFQHYVPIILSSYLPTILEKRANKKEEVYKSFMGNLVSEIFIMGSMIGTVRPDIINGIYKQNGDNYEQLLKTSRDGLMELYAIVKEKGHNLNAIGNLFLTSGIDMLPKDDLSNGLPRYILQEISKVCICGYTFGHDLPQVFLEMLSRRLRDVNSNEPNNLFILGFLSVYIPVINEEDRVFLSNQSEKDLSYQNGTLVQKFINIYKNIANELVNKYEKDITSLR